MLTQRKLQKLNDKFKIFLIGKPPLENGIGKYIKLINKVDLPKVIDATINLSGSV